MRRFCGPVLLRVLQAGLPWFDYYDGDRKAIEGAKALGNIKSVKEIAQAARQDISSEEKSTIDYLVKQFTGSNVSDGSW